MKRPDGPYASPDSAARLATSWTQLERLIPRFCAAASTLRKTSGSKRTIAATAGAGGFALD